MKKLVYTSFFIVLVFSCSPKKNDIPPSTKVSIKPETLKTISISRVCEFNFRRSLADAQFMNDEKEIEKYYRRQEKSNPVLVHGRDYDTTMKKRFEELRMVKGEELLVHNFPKNKKAHLKLDDPSGRKINVAFIGNTNRDVKARPAGPDSCEIMYFPLGNFKYAVKDIIPGGNKEVVVLEENYVMLGYNFDMLVYEIKRK